MAYESATSDNLSPRVYRVLLDTRLASRIAARAARLPYIAASAWTAMCFTLSLALIVAHLYPYSANAWPPVARG